MNRGNVALFVCLCAAAFNFQTVFGTVKIFGTNIGILKKPVQCYKNPEHIDGDVSEVRLQYHQNTGMCETITYLTGRDFMGVRKDPMTLEDCLSMCKAFGVPPDI